MYTKINTDEFPFSISLSLIFFIFVWVKTIVQIYSTNFNQMITLTGFNNYIHSVKDLLIILQYVADYSKRDWIKQFQRY